MTNELWVYVEAEDGRPRNVGLELLAPGRRLADIQGGALAAVVIGAADGVDGVAEAAASHGADKVYIIAGEEYRDYSTDAYTAAFSTLVRKHEPKTILIGATVDGRDLGPRLACRLQTGLTADCTMLDIDEESGNMAWTRPAFGGNLMATILCPEHRPQIGTVRPGVFKKGEPVAGRTAELVREEIHVAPESIRVRLIERIRETAGELVDLESADVIVAGGRGVGGPQHFAVLKELAEALDSSVGASRAAVDAGWIPHAHQIGQTGKTVGPKLYIACGISGAVQHAAGIAGAEVVVAINKDPEAPIFNIADYAIVGDLFEVVPALTAEVKRLKAQ